MSPRTKLGIEQLDSLFQRQFGGRVLPRAHFGKLSTSVSGRIEINSWLQTRNNLNICGLDTCTGVRCQCTLFASNAQGYSTIDYQLKA
jgi:hypothetical protein